MKRALLLAVALPVASSLASCGSSPTEPDATSRARTTLKITVTRCHLDGSVVAVSYTHLTLPTSDLV